MIKETDASKSDERRVKNKSNSLTHKWKGETRTMCIQGTKHWQLGMFFVISLTLMVGLFVNTAPAHNIANTITGVDDDATPIGNVTITEGTVTAESMVDLKIRYTATTTLADPKGVDHDDDTSTANVPTSLGRIRINLPAGWGPDHTAIPAETIHTSRPIGQRDATYLTVRKTSAVTFADFSNGTVTGSRSAGWTIDIDVNSMKNRQYVELTINNLMIGSLGDAIDGSGDDGRSNRYTDRGVIKNLLQVEVLSDSDATDGTTAAVRPSAFTHTPKTLKPKEDLVALAGAVPAHGSNTQPTITVNRKTSGKLAIKPNDVTAGSKQDFTFTYTTTEDMITDGDNDGEIDSDNTEGGGAKAIEIRLPANWPSPTPFNFNDDNQLVDSTTPTPVMLKDAKGPHVYLSGSASRLDDFMVSVINGADISVEDPDAHNGMGSIVRVDLGARGLRDNASLVLKYKDVIVQGAMQDKVPIETFSGASPAV